LTLLKSRGKYASRELEVSDISRKLKLLSLELDIPIIILVQLNRDAENREPTMANIRESRTVEQNCDNIIFLHNASGDDKSSVTNIQITLAKQRQGTTGRFELTFDKRYSKFKPKEEQNGTYKRYPTKSN
jgi:replicative DNA helicase